MLACVDSWIVKESAVLFHQAEDPSKMKRLIWRQLGMEFLFKEVTFYYV